MEKSRAQPTKNRTWIRSISPAPRRIRSRSLSQPPQRIRSNSISPPPQMSPLNVVLLGKTGSGKSASANTILGRKVFEEDFSPESVTKTCSNRHTVVHGRQITVIDTPGLFGTEKPTEQLNGEMEKSVEMSHAFLLVIRLDVRFTEEERNAVKWIQENFGEEALRYTIVLLTHGDGLKGKPVEDFLRKSPELSSLTEHCGGRYHVFNNKSKNSTQVRELKEKIEAMVKENVGKKLEMELEKERSGKQEAEMKADEERKKRVEAEKRAEEEIKRTQEEKQKRQHAEREQKKKEEEIRYMKNITRVSVGAAVGIGGAVGVAGGAAAAATGGGTAAVVAGVAGVAAVLASAAVVAAVGAIERIFDEKESEGNRRGGEREVRGRERKNKQRRI